MSDRFAVVFPGQGSQSLGMLKDIAEHFNEVEHVFKEASSILNYDLWQLVQEGPQEKLDQTQYTQPALLAASYAIWQILEARNPLHPVIFAGHSLGEYTALLCAKAFHFQDAISLVAARGQYMQEAVKNGEGAMAAIVGLDEEMVATICQDSTRAHEILSPANFNSIGQVVIAGHQQAVERAILLAKERGAKLVMRLPVSVPSHCLLMKSASERLARLLDTISIQSPHIPVLNNVEVKCYDSAADIRDGLVRQLYEPVRWVETIQNFSEQQRVTCIVECGPGKVLTGLSKRIDKHLRLFSTFDRANLQALLTLEVL